jgi:hypothetical protein
MGLAKRGDVLSAIAKGAFVNPGELQPLFTRWFREAHGDEDLAGKVDIQNVALEAFGTGGDGLDLSALGKMLSAPPPAAAAAPATPTAPGANPAVPGVDSAQVQQLLQQLNKTMGGVDDQAQ